MIARRTSRRLARGAAWLLCGLGLAGCASLSPAPQPTAPSAPSGSAPPPPRGDASSASQSLLTQSRAERAAGRYPQATASLERALRIEPNDPVLWIELGELELATGNPEQAQAMARKALTLTGGDRALEARAERLLRAAGSR